MSSSEGKLSRSESLLIYPFGCVKVCLSSNDFAYSRPMSSPSDSKLLIISRFYIFSFSLINCTEVFAVSDYSCSPTIMAIILMPAFFDSCANFYLVSLVFLFCVSCFLFSSVIINFVS